MCYAFLCVCTLFVTFNVFLLLVCFRRLRAESDPPRGEQREHRGEQPHPQVRGGRHRAVSQHHLGRVLHRGRHVGEGLHGYRW